MGLHIAARGCFCDVLHLPQVPVNLISTRKLWDDNKITSTSTDKCTLTFPSGSTVGFKSVGTNHYYCVAKSEQKLAKHHVHMVDDLDHSIHMAQHGVSADTIHARLGHCGVDRAQLARGHEEVADANAGAAAAAAVDPRHPVHALAVVRCSSQL